MPLDGSTNKPEILQQAFLLFGDIHVEPFLKNNPDIGHASRPNCYQKTILLKLELAALVDWGKAFVMETYDLERDGPLTFSCYIRVEEDKHFLLKDIQISKGKPRAPQKITIEVNHKEEEIFYRIVPCGGVKHCAVDGCSYVSKLYDIDLVITNECPVEFVYIWPVNISDKRRWLTGLVSRSDLQSDNLHNHASSKQRV